MIDARRLPRVDLCACGGLGELSRELEKAANQFALPNAGKSKNQTLADVKLVGLTAGALHTRIDEAVDDHSPS